MYPSTDPSGALGALFAGGIVILFIYLAVVFIGVYISSLIIKAAVRNGVTEALKRNGVADALTSHTPYVQGYPPVQPHSVPAAGSAEHPPYYTAH
jgi:hypothetical protein